MRARAGLGEQVVRDPAVAESAELSPVTYGHFDDDLRAATTGQDGLLSRSAELDADALVVRATVQTYRWIDGLQDAAYRTIGSVAGRALGYLAPEVALGGAVVSAGLIETDALDRDGVTAYLDELAENNPELMEHAAGGGGLLDGLQMRSLLTTPALAGDSSSAARGGLAAIGVDPFSVDLGSALRDTAGSVVAPAEVEDATDQSAVAAAARARGSDDDALLAEPRRHRPPGRSAVATSRSSPGRTAGPAPACAWSAATTCPTPRGSVRALERAVRQHDDGPAQVMLVGFAQGGPTALEIAGMADSDLFTVDRVVTAGAPSALVPRVPKGTRMLALEDRNDPVALLGSVVNADADNRMTVVFDGGCAGGHAALRRRRPRRRPVRPSRAPRRARRDAGARLPHLGRAARGCRARTRRAGPGCGTRPSAPPRRTSSRRSRRCPSAAGARG